jgi:hypothetical protein
MPITDDRLSELLVRREPGSDLADRNPVAALVVESAAATHPERAEEIREAGRFLCELLWPPDDEAPTLTLPVAMHTFVREEHTPPEEMRRHLVRTTDSDLLLGLSASALLRQPRVHRRGRRMPHGDAAVLRTLYLLVRMHETQAEITALERALKE